MSKEIEPPKSDIDRKIGWRHNEGLSILAGYVIIAFALATLACMAGLYLRIYDLLFDPETDWYLDVDGVWMESIDHSACFFSAIVTLVATFAVFKALNMLLNRLDAWSQRQTDRVKNEEGD